MYGASGGNQTGMENPTHFALPQFNLGNHAGAVRRRTWRTRFMPEHVYEHYARQNAITLASLPSGHLRYREIPPEFIDVMPLDRALLATDVSGVQTAHTTGAFGWVTSLFKVISTEDGCAYALRRVDGVRSTPAILAAVTEAWARAAHPSVIPLRRAFPATSTRGGPVANALFFLHDFYPAARSLRELYLDVRGDPIPEATLWSYICQLVAGLRAVHDADLTMRGLRPAHILVTGANRLRFASCGVLDVLESDVPKSAADLRALDVMSLGQLVLQLAVRSRTAHYPVNVNPSLELVKAMYSPEVGLIIQVLLYKQPPPSIHEVCRLLAPQLLTELDSVWDHNDAMEHLLGREADNGRIMRLLLKLGFVNERPEYEGDPAWAETGDRYLLKLFRDFVFHQITDDGAPVLDVAHVLDALQNLDVGSQSRVLLSSRDGQSVLVSSFATLRTALDGAFNDLSSSSRREPASAAGEDAGGGGRPGEQDLPAWMSRPKVPAIVRSRTGGAVRARGRTGMGGLMMGMSGGMLPFNMAHFSMLAGGVDISSMAMAMAASSSGGEEAQGDGQGGEQYAAEEGGYTEFHPRVQQDEGGYAVEGEGEYIPAGRNGEEGDEGGYAVGGEGEYIPAGGDEGYNAEGEGLLLGYGEEAQGGGSAAFSGYAADAAPFVPSWMR